MDNFVAGKCVFCNSRNFSRANCVQKRRCNCHDLSYTRSSIALQRNCGFISWDCTDFPGKSSCFCKTMSQRWEGIFPQLQDQESVTRLLPQLIALDSPVGMDFYRVCRDSMPCLNDETTNTNLKNTLSRCI